MWPSPVKAPATIPPVFWVIFRIDRGTTSEKSRPQVWRWISMQASKSATDDSGRKVSPSGSVRSGKGVDMARPDFVIERGRRRQDPLTPPTPLSHRPPPDRERGERQKRRSCSGLMRVLAVLPLLPVGGRAMGEEGRGDEGALGGLRGHSAFRNTTAALCPPNAKDCERALRIGWESTRRTKLRSAMGSSRLRQTCVVWCWRLRTVTAASRAPLAPSVWPRSDLVELTSGREPKIRDRTAASVSSLAVVPVPW